MKRICCFFLALALAAPMSACSMPKAAGGSPAPATGTAAPLAPAATPTPAAPSGPAEGEAPVREGKTLVAYFSATGTTEGVAAAIAGCLGADLFEIVPETPYTDTDLAYHNDCRANAEQQDVAARPAIDASCVVENMAAYDVVFLGHPIWWGIPPKIMRTFMESYDWSGKTIVPFCTSGGSGYSSEGLPELAEGAVWLEGRRFSGGAGAAEIAEWVNGLGLGLGGESGTLTIQNGNSTVVYALNGSPAAQSLLAQLPLALEVEPFGANEQTFYPPEKLVTADTPAITSAEAGTLAYYAPWGDVVLFYEGFSGGGGGLYELGRAVGNVEAIRNFSGDITVTAE